MRFELPSSVKNRFASLSKADIAKLSDSVDDKTGCMLLSPVQFFDVRELEESSLAKYRGVVIGQDLDGNAFLLLEETADRLSDAVYFFNQDASTVLKCAPSFDHFCDKGMLPKAEWKPFATASASEKAPAMVSTTVLDDDGFAEAKRSVDQWIEDDLIIMKDETKGPIQLINFLVQAADSQTSPEETLAEMVDLAYVDEVFLDEDQIGKALQTIA